ncbi:MAG: serine/threonine protein kinase, partial [Gammaproteobacteria bacterium]|nr:serine/threonine protein kinase [Gammaproteobacteria bacterium]
ICYEMLAGQKPYTGTTAMEVLQQHVSAPLPLLPPALERYQPFLNQLLAKARAERFAAAREIIAAATALLPAVAAAEAQPSAA